MGKKDDSKFKLRKGVFREIPVSNHDNTMDLMLPPIGEQELVAMLPCVSVVTITKNRGVFAGVMLYNWVHFTYPREKLEWVILDDSDDKTYNLRDYLPEDDQYIRYYHVAPMKIDEKRNKVVELAKYEYIVHMDDDDYYFPDSILAKIRIMLQYKCQGVLSSPVGIYDMMERTSVIPQYTRNGCDTNAIAEASLAYKKDYWRKFPFIANPQFGLGEGQAFIHKNFDKFIKIHFLFNMVGITHTKNITINSRRFVNENPNTTAKTGKFEDVFPKDFTTHVLDNLRNILEASYVKP